VTNEFVNTVPILHIRKRLGRDDWGVPIVFGPSGWRIDSLRDDRRIIVTDGPAPDGEDGDSHSLWRHASISRPEAMPTYDDLALLHRVVWPEGWAYQLFAPPDSHVNIHAFALHLWGRPDGRKLLPNFGAAGSI
jgi:hypothetical protein